MRDRQAEKKKIIFAVPGTKHYETSDYCNNRASFANISVTGTKCQCLCEHCRGKTLSDMIPAEDPAEFIRVIDELSDKGCRGVLVSGGSDQNGEVPLAPFAAGIAYAKTKGLKVLVHCGLITRETALLLKEAGTDQVLMDIIGDEKTIREIYHLNKKPQDYYEAMKNCLEIGLDFVPHIVLGLYNGQMSGEYQALEMIRQANPKVVVLVVFKPLRGTPMEKIKPVDIVAAGSFIKNARRVLAGCRLTLGCAKPPGAYKIELERYAVENGLDVIAFPAEKTIAYAAGKGMEISYQEECCCSCQI